MVLSTIIFILTLISLILIHELGHFLVAKKFGIKVEEFGFGIPPKIWGKKIGETLVTINWLPFGGFVRLLGEDAVDGKILANPRSFAHKKVTQRIGVAVAGVVMNLLLAFIIFYITLSFASFKFQVPLIVDHQFIGVQQQEESYALIAVVAKDSPAEKAGLKVGERIIGINGTPVSDSNTLINKTKELAGGKVKLKLLEEDSKQTKDVEVEARKNPPAGQGPLGIALQSVHLANLEYKSPAQKLFAGPLHAYNLTVYSGKVMGKVISQSFAKKTFEPLSHSVSGPIGIGVLANDILTQSPKPLLSYLDFIGLISLNLGIINLLPIPAMDGGRLFFLLIELISGRRVHAGFERWVHTIGMVILLGIAILITFSDIGKLFT